MSWAEIARRQAGVITRGQLNEQGLSAGVIDRLISSGALVGYSKGVYVVRGAPVTYQANLWRAVLSTRGILSHTTAAHLWGLVDGPTHPTHVTIARHRRVKPPADVRLHRIDMAADVITRRYGLPITTRTWTALDHLACLPYADACTFADRAMQQGWLTRDDVAHRLQDRPGRKGNAILQRIAAVTGDGAEAESERQLHQILRKSGIEGWVAQYEVWAHGYVIAKVDVAFPGARLAIEIDGWAHHSKPDRFQRDRTRQNDLVALGWTVLRFTWRDLIDRPGYVAATIRRQLGRIA